MTLSVNWKALLVAVETIIVSALAGFAGSIGTTTGGAIDAKHLQAAGVAAALGALYRVAGAVSAAVGSATTSPQAPATAPGTTPPLY